MSLPIICDCKLSQLATWEHWVATKCWRVGEMESL